MEDKFDEEFIRIDTHFFQALPPGKNPWAKANQIVTSLDVAKKPEYRDRLSTQGWDLVVFDEAHKLSAAMAGAKESKTQRYRLAEAVSPTAENLLLFTATPYKGAPYAYFKLVSLADPYLFTSSEHLRENMEWLKEVTIRRLKENVTYFDGKKIFLPREASTVAIELTKPEKELYEAVTDYVRYWFDKAKEIENPNARRNIGFAMTILQRRLTSSVYAIRRSLERRYEKLEGLLRAKEEPRFAPLEEELIEDYMEEPADLTDRDRQWVKEKLEAFTAYTIDKFKSLMLA